MPNVAIAGARGIANIETNARPKAWMGLHYLSEAREASFAVLSSVMQTETTDDPEFNWFERDIETFEIVSTVAALAGDVSLAFDDGSGNPVSFNLRNGSLIKNDRTKEICLVTADPTANNSAIGVTRAWQTSLTAGLAVNVGDRWTIMGFADVDNTTSPTPLSTNANQKTNFTQLMREPISIGALTMSTNFRTGNEYKRRRKEAFMQFLRRWERQFIHGEPKDDGVTANPESRRTQTGGILYPISTNIWDFLGSVSESAFDTQVEKVFRYGSRSKVAISGGVAIKTINIISKFSGGTIYLLPGETTYGLRIHEYQHASGDIQMLYTPMMGISTNYNAMMVIIDTMKLSRVIMVGWDLKLRKDVQENGVLGVKDEYVMDCGIKLGLEKHHAVFSNMNAFSTA